MAHPTSMRWRQISFPAIVGMFTSANSRPGRGCRWKATATGAEWPFRCSPDVAPRPVESFEAYLRCGCAVPNLSMSLLPRFV
jgi:hypothetical protein